MAWNNQEAEDARRRVYLLTHPSDLTEQRVAAFMHSISGTLRTKVLGFLSVPTIVFETWATDQGIVHRLLVPPSVATFVVQHLESMIPGVHVAEDKERPEVQWDEVTELGMTHPARQINIPSGTDLSHSMLASVQSLEGDQTVLIQWVIGPKIPEKPPISGAQTRSYEAGVFDRLVGRLDAKSDEIEDRRKKLEHANFLAVGRIAVKGQEGQAKQLTQNALLALSTTTTGGNRFVRKTTTGPKAIAAANNASTPYNFPAQLSVPELTALVSWSVGTPYIAGLPKSRTRVIHVNNSVPTSGPGMTTIGASNAKGKERDIAIAEIDRMMHVHIMGPIGSGKTMLSTSMAEQDMKSGRGVVLIETKGDLFHAIMERVPAHRLKDVIVWDLDDESFPVGFNVLKQGSSRAAVNELVNLITTLYPESGPLTTGPLYHGLHALAEVEGSSLVDLMTLVSPETDEQREWRRQLVPQIQSRAIRKYWEERLTKDKAIEAREAEPLKRRFWQFTSRSEIRNSLGQSDSSFTMDDVVQEGKILLVNLNGTRIGNDSASVIGTLIVSALWNSVRRVQHDQPVILYLDEFQNFVTMPTDPAEMLAQSRSFGLGMVLAHQHTGQLDRELRDAVLANARSKIVFQTSQADARLMASEFGAQFKADDFLNLERREAIARVATASGVSAGFTMKTKDITPATANPRLIRETSREAYGRPVDDVERAIEARYQAKQEQTGTRPKIGFEPWTREG